MSDFSLKGKTAIVTGAASGIGKAIAGKFHEQGANVYVLDLNIPEDQVRADIGRAHNLQLFFYKCDVRSQPEVIDIFNKINSIHPVDILVNNAGIGLVGNIENTLEEDFKRLFEVNVNGIYNCMYALIPLMKKNKGGVILNMASIAGSKAVAERFAYSATKGAVLSMTYSVAKDYLKYNIRCNSISPARIHTAFVDNFIAKNYPGKEREMFEQLSKSQPVGRMGKPEEVAALALYLCSDEASFITGVDYPFDGGYINLS